MVDDEHVPGALRHSFAVLDAVGQGGPAGLDVPEISARSGCHPRTVYRHLASLRALGMIDASPTDSRYRLGPGIAALALQASDQANFLRKARQFAQETGEETGLPVHVTVFDHGTAVTVASADSGLRNSGEMAPIVLGSRRPAHASASGKVLLAHSPSAFRAYTTRVVESFTENTITAVKALEDECAAVRELGWAIDNQEFIPGVTCLAVAVWGANQRVVGTLSVSTSLMESAHLRRDELLDLLRPAAAAFSASIGGKVPA